MGGGVQANTKQGDPGPRGTWVPGDVGPGDLGTRRDRSRGRWAQGRCFLFRSTWSFSGMSNPFFHIFVCVWKLYYLKTLGPSLTPRVPAASCSEGCNPVSFIILLCHFIVTEAPTVGIPQGWTRELVPREPWHCGHLGCFPPWVLGTSCASQGQQPPCSPPTAVSHQQTVAAAPPNAACVRLRTTAVDGGCAALTRAVGTVPTRNHLPCAIVSALGVSQTEIPAPNDCDGRR